MLPHSDSTWKFNQSWNSCQLELASSVTKWPYFCPEPTRLPTSHQPIFNLTDGLANTGQKVSRQTSWGRNLCKYLPRNFCQTLVLASSLTQQHSDSTSAHLKFLLVRTWFKKLQYFCPELTNHQLIFNWHKPSKWNKFWHKSRRFPWRGARGETIIWKFSGH